MIISTTCIAALQVQNGKNAMPAWEDRLDEDEINAVAAYVFDQATNNKW
jgi:cytochrome c6